MTSQNSDASTSTIYQSPGWPYKSAGVAAGNDEYDYD